MNPTPLAGILVMVLATFVFAVQDAITKSISTELPVAQIVFVRFTAFAVLSLIIAHRNEGVRLAFKSAAPVVQLVRCVLMCGEIALFVYALRFLGIAQIHALFACFPLFVAALSVPLLKESVGWRRWAAVIVGFLGTLIIVRPGSDVFDPYALLPLLGALLYALYNLLTRKVSRHDSYTTSLVYFGVVGAVVSGLFAIGQWQEISAPVARQLAYLCMTSIVAHMMLIKALQLTEAVVLQPFQYLILPWAIVLGYVVFDETLDMYTLLGAAIVVSSGIFVAHREYRLARVTGSANASSP